MTPEVCMLTVRTAEHRALPVTRFGMLDECRGWDAVHAMALST